MLRGWRRSWPWQTTTCWILLLCRREPDETLASAEVNEVLSMLRLSGGTPALRA